MKNKVQCHALLLQLISAFLQQVENNFYLSIFGQDCFYLEIPATYWKKFNSSDTSSTSVYLLIIFLLDFLFTIFDIRLYSPHISFGFLFRNLWHRRIKSLAPMESQGEECEWNLYRKKQNKIILTNNNNIMYTCMHTKHKMNENKKTKQNCRKNRVNNADSAFIFLISRILSPEF